MRQRKSLWLTALVIAIGLTACTKSNGKTVDTTTVKADQSESFSDLEPASEDDRDTALNSISQNEKGFRFFNLKSKAFLF